MLGQKQQQRLAQKLSPQQIIYMKLLQVSTANLEEKVKEEMESNPALDNDEAAHVEDPYDLNNEEEWEFSNDKDNSENTDELLMDNVDIDDYLRDDGMSASSNYYHDDDDDVGDSLPIKVENSFHDYLTSQLGMLNLDSHNLQVAHQIIGSIDDDGYLTREPMSIVDDLVFHQNITTTEAEVQFLIEKIKEFDPPGIACTTLQECLVDQLKRAKLNKAHRNHAIAILEKYYTEFTKKQYNKIKQGLKLNEDDFRIAIAAILKLNPKPGSAFSSNAHSNFILPDFFIYNNNGKLELTLNSRNAPELHVSQSYLDMQQAFAGGEEKMKKSDKEALIFINQKIEAAKWFIESIRQRQRTLLITMNAILNLQKDFFLTGDEMTLRPMILKDVANLINMDISTVSRVVNSKYVQTEFGVFLLKYFFSEKLTTQSGEEVSTMEVKALISRFVEQEDKVEPLSDDALAELLLEKGYPVARRTIAKYREVLSIPVARLRRQA